MHIRPATLDDIPALLEIYAPYVLTSAATFEYDVPSLDTWYERCQTLMQHFPYLVACDNTNKIVGYAYLSYWNSRPAASKSCETSIYLAQDARSLGIGRVLYQSLEEAGRAQGITHLCARITWKEQDDQLDPHYSPVSVNFHTAMGWSWCGVLHRCGYKFDRWYDLVWMEKSLV